MTVAYCLDKLRDATGISNAGPGAVAFAKAQIAAGRSLLTRRQPNGRETHFVDLHGQPVLAVWDARAELVVTFLPVRIDPARLQAFVSGMLASRKRCVMTTSPRRPAADTQAEHDRLVEQARTEGGWAGQMIAAWAGICARNGGLTIDCPFAADEADLSRRWHDAYGQGAAATIPTAEIVPLTKTTEWAPKPGITHAALCAPQD